jgi:hypothetical protein
MEEAVDVLPTCLTVIELVVAGVEAGFQWYFQVCQTIYNSQQRGA